MADPLIIQFGADTSRAQSAMASLAASIAGNMASAGVALSGLAANSNNTGSALGALQQNLTRAAGAIGNDVKNIVSATASAATAEKATLQGVVTSFTAAAASSQAAQAGVQAGIAGTTTAITTLGAQIPALRTLLGAFIAFEAAKLVFASVSASIDAAREHIADFVKIGKEAERAGVSPEYFQRVTLGAEKYGLTVDQAAASLNRFRDAADVKLGEGKDGRNTSALSDRLQQNVLANNITGAEKGSVESANGNEAKLRALLAIIQRLKDEGKDLVAFDLAGRFVGPEFERQLRNGEDAVNKLKAAMDNTSTTVAGIQIVGAEEVERANQLDAKAKDIANTLASALAPIQKDITNSVLDTYEAFLQVESAIVRAVGAAVSLYTQVTSIVGGIKEAVNQIPYIGKVLTAGNQITALREAGKAIGILGQAEAELPEIEVKAPRRRGGGGNPLPQLGGGRAARGGSGGSERLDAVETLINQLEKARDTAKAELDNVEKTNVEREKAVAIAKAEAAAREEVKKGNRESAALSDDERKRVLAGAEAWQTYKDRTMDAQQAIRQAAEASRYFGEAASNAFADAILEGRSFSDILNSLSKQVFRSGLQAAFTGQGPLAGLLGTAPTASSGDTVGGVASLFTGLLRPGSSNGSPLPGAQGPSLPGSGVGDFFASLFRANGGPVEAGQAYTVGERGREMFIPNSNGQIVPIAKGNGGGSSGPSVRMGDINISAPGADRQGLMELRSYVDSARREDRRLIGQSLAGWKENN